jgi:hypothetical protein
VCGGDVRSPPGDASSTGLPAVSGERTDPWCGEIQLEENRKNFWRLSTNSYERVITALRVEQPDQVSIVEWMIHPNVINALDSGLTEQEFMAKHLDAVST